MNTYKKPLVLVLVMVLIAGIGWYVLAGSVDDAEIAAIAAETERIVNSRSTTTQAALEYKLQDLSVAEPNKEYPRTDVLGISFATPWGAGSVTSDEGEMVSLAFPGGQDALVIRHTQQTAELHDYLANFETNLSDQETTPLEFFRQELGEDFSNQTYRKYLLETTLDTVREAETAAEARTRANALILRAGMSISSNSEAFAFETDQAKGFLIDATSVLENGAITLTFWMSNGQGYDLVLHNGGTREAAETIVSTLQTEG